MANPYDEPEKFNLTPIADIELNEPNYSFDIRVVWRHKDGRIFTARDAGCSCPSPFEDYHSLLDLDILDMHALEEEVNAAPWPDAGEKLEFLSKVRGATRIKNWTKS